MLLLKEYPARFEAFMNSVYGHGAELDDGNKKAAAHTGVHLIPAVFALADKLGSGKVFYPVYFRMRIA